MFLQFLQVPTTPGAKADFQPVHHIPSPWIAMDCWHRRRIKKPFWRLGRHQLIWKVSSLGQHPEMQRAQGGYAWKTMAVVQRRFQHHCWLFLFEYGYGTNKQCYVRENCHLVTVRNGEMIKDDGFSFAMLGGSCGSFCPLISTAATLGPMKGICGVPGRRSHHDAQKSKQSHPLSMNYSPYSPAKKGEY